jgi:hypothetical protein
MSQLKSAWITPHDADLASLTLESANPGIEYLRVNCTTHLFPENPNPEYPLKHILVIGLLSYNDLILLRNTIDKHLIRS